MKWLMFGQAIKPFFFFYQVSLSCCQKISEPWYIRLIGMNAVLVFLPWVIFLCSLETKLMTHRSSEKTNMTRADLHYCCPKITLALILHLKITLSLSVSGYFWVLRSVATASLRSFFFLGCLSWTTCVRRCRALLFRLDRAVVRQMRPTSQ